MQNPYGTYGSTYSPTSINNPCSAYGSPYSSNAARNPYASTPPVVVYEPRGSAPSAARTRAVWERVEPVQPRR